MNIKNLRRNKFGGIDLDYKHPDYGWIPFTADAGDVSKLGSEIYKLASSKKVKPYKPNLDDLAAEVRLERDIKLDQLDQLVSNPLRYASYSEEYKQVLTEYHVALKNVPQQEGFPEQIEWPELANE